MYCYIIAPAHNSNRSHGIHGPQSGPNSQYFSGSRYVIVLFHSHCHYIFIMSLFPSVPLSCASIVHISIVLA